MTISNIVSNPLSSAVAAIALSALAFASLPAHASRTTDLSAVCKVGIHQTFAAEDEVFRFKYKGDRGARAEKLVRLEVIPADAERFIAECQIDARNYRLLDVRKES